MQQGLKILYMSLANQISVYYFLIISHVFVMANKKRGGRVYCTDHYLIIQYDLFYFFLRTLPLTFRLSLQPIGRRTSSCQTVRRTCFYYPICEIRRSAARDSRTLLVSLPLAWPMWKKTACSIFTVQYTPYTHLTQLVMWASSSRFIGTDN